MSIKFVNNEQLSFGSSDNKHLLLIGDNKDGLEYLLLTYKGKIKCIYIDPPYGKNGKGKYAKTNYNNKIKRSDLLEMLRIRLVLARQLLSEDGGHRKFILCQNNEKTDTTPHGIAYDVTAKRLKRVMTGECYDGTKPEAWLKKHEPYGGALDVLEYVK